MLRKGGGDCYTPLFSLYVRFPPTLTLKFYSRLSSSSVRPVFIVRARLRIASAQQPQAVFHQQRMTEDHHQSTSKEPKNHGVTQRQARSCPPHWSLHARAPRRQGCCCREESRTSRIQLENTTITRREEYPSERTHVNHQTSSATRRRRDHSPPQSSSRHRTSRSPRARASLSRNKRPHSTSRVKSVGHQTSSAGPVNSNRPMC